MQLCQKYIPNCTKVRPLLNRRGMPFYPLTVLIATNRGLYYSSSLLKHESQIKKQYIIDSVGKDMTSKSYINIKYERNDDAKILNKFKLYNTCYVINSFISSLLEKLLK